jgi:hypothetical protein
MALLPVFKPCGGGCVGVGHEPNPAGLKRGREHMLEAFAGPDREAGINQPVSVAGGFDPHSGHQRKSLFYRRKRGIRRHERTRRDTENGHRK